MKRRPFLTLLTLCCIFTFAYGKDDEKAPASPTMPFAKGADISWVTEMEANGISFYDSTGAPTECMALLKGLGMNAIRLRVWVNPTDGWCNKTDLLVKAKRANDLGMRIMIDFHYSDWWADPGKQNKPAAWENLSFNDLCSAVSNHTSEILTALKSSNITPEWVQVGNETGNGMLWNDGKASTNMAQYTILNNAGYDAVKSVFPNAIVIVHVQNGQHNHLFRWLFDELKKNNGKWDVIGMSLYPQANNWQNYNDSCLFNITDMISRYRCKVMICEVGMPYNEADAAKLFLTDLITRAKAIASHNCLGVFYWEPESCNGWKGYPLGAFDDNGKPSKTLDAFK
jgi:arabinogalactan endo-1,4-beta-galactosidase